MLGRPDYLSADQSAGVVFSHAFMALEVRRRAAAVLPIWERYVNLAAENGANPWFRVASVNLSSSP